MLRRQSEKKVAQMKAMQMRRQSTIIDKMNIQSMFRDEVNRR